MGDRVHGPGRGLSAGSGGKRAEAGRLGFGECAKGPRLGGTEPRRAPSERRRGVADPSGERVEQQRDADEEAVDEEVEEVGEDV